MSGGLHPAHHARRFPDRPALIVAETGETVTYRELDERSNRGAHLFRAMGLRAGDTVAILMVNGPGCMDVVWAAQRAGLYFVGLSTKLTVGEVAYILRDSGAAALVHSPGFAPVAAAAAPSSVALLSHGDPQDADGFERRAAAFPATPIADEAPGQDMLYSSGTTGQPKGIRMPPRTDAIDDATTVTTLACRLYAMDEETVFLSPAPLYHAAPLRFVGSVQALGGTVVLMERFDAAAVLAAIARYRVTHAQFVPTHFVRLLRLPAEERARYDHRTLRAVFHAAAPCPVDVKRAMLDWWGPIVHEYYSCTETIGFTAASPQEWIGRPGTVGRAVLGRIHICDDDGRELPAGQVGTIYFEGRVPLAYHNDPAKTAAAHNAQGWATVGDVGRVDDDGYLFLTDRKSFMIISGGVNIYPQEVENALISHPRVADAAVIGVPDADLGERVVAVVQPGDPADATEAFADELRRWLRDRISGVKMPRAIDFRSELPREPTGKLFKRLLRDEYRAAAEAPG